MISDTDIKNAIRVEVCKFKAEGTSIELVDVELDPDWVYKIVTGKGATFAARYRGQDGRGRWVFQSFGGRTTWLRPIEIQTISPLTQVGD